MILNKILPVFTGNRFGFLLASLFGLLSIAAFAQHNILTDEFFLTALTAILCTSLNAVEAATKHFFSVVIFGVIAIITNIISYILPAQEIDIVAAIINLGFIFVVILLLFGYIFTGREVTLNTIMGGASLYILIGVAFGFLYMIVDYIVPHSFASATGANYEGVEALLDRFLYFSFVTLTTVGYGDVTPLSQPARYLSVIEALIAQLYLTILLGRLVGLHLSQKKD